MNHSERIKNDSRYQQFGQFFIATYQNQ